MIKDIINKLSIQLNLPYDQVLKIYNLYWLYIKNQIQNLPLKEDLTEEEFNQLQTSFNIISLGKLYCTYKDYKSIKDKYAKYKKHSTNV